MKQLIKLALGLFLLVGIVSCTSQNQKIESSSAAPDAKPNIVVIYLDDLGYGDVGAYGATEIATPNIDQLANGGVRFTQGYATSATCTPSRYALLTGQYPWRKEGAQILPGSAPLLIDTAQETLPKMLKKQGYHTGIVGKWHLGLGSGNVDWNQHISPGPNEVGFDYAYIMAATQDRVPTVYIENGKVENLDPNDPIQISYQENFEGEPTGKDNPELLNMTWHHGHNNSIVNGIPRIGYMTGGESAKWKDEEMADNFLAHAQHYVQQHKEESFFLYYALQQPHVPRTPHPRFVGKSGMGPRGDVIVEADWMVGQFIETLKKEGLLENTLIILSSDNGPVLNDGYNDQSDELLGAHDPRGGLRGGKYSLFEAGTRVPFITYWKGKIQPRVSDALVCQLDVYSSLAQLVGGDLSTADSQDLLPAFLGQVQKGRDNLVLEATSRTAFRQGDWAMIPPYQGKPVNTQVNIELGNDTAFQLYNLKEDLGQQTNLAQQKPEKLQQMLADFETIRGKGYGSTTPLELK
ncbi:arylsulfatase [Reichenbachiella agarivorans]|uniref:Arylsulfatase n=1 Tax=Reichenbachiella agarivorans TaxID=2979464 RepID=A0ABY6CUT6_9BACT|nr:arylsulfatase [Reichenbachiella agarivorans]UXP31995.1 arylsulfatase [Reichenbachiella agarivorans]